jgi:CheY-like chemotaxis protein
VLLVIEYDLIFAASLAEYAQKKGLSCLIAKNGEMGLMMAVEHKPQAIILDMILPGISGLNVLDALKQDPALRHIPVYMISADDDNREAYRRGAVGFLSKSTSHENIDRVLQQIRIFISKQVKSLLIVDSDENALRSLIELFADIHVEISTADLGATALELIHAQNYDCILLDVNLPDLDGFELLKTIREDEHIERLPVIVYTGRELSEEVNHLLMRYADSVIPRKGVRSQERLFDEMTLYLHQVVADLPTSKQKIIQNITRQGDVLIGKKILIVDDDTRNSFALSGLLSGKGMRVEIAPDGKKALELLNSVSDIDLVLMDVMMPVMDGLETTRQIREMPQFNGLPILALTAKAMEGDREKCLASGANDYLSKPVHPELLFTMLRVWLYKK